MTNRYQRRRARGLTILEVVIAMAILTIAILLFGSGMIAATRAEAKAAEHTQAVMIGNYLIEQVRRDPNFWDATATGDYDPLCPGKNCWPHMSPNNLDSAGNVLPPYDDSLATPPSNSAWHAGFIPITTPNLTLPSYHYLWRADPIDSTKFSANKGVAAITIELYVDQQGTQDVYVTKAMSRLL